VRLVANKDYWRGAPKVDEVIYQTYQNQDTMAQDLKTGAIQSGWNVPSAQFTTLDNEAALTGIKAVTIGFDELGFNCADKKMYPKSTGHPIAIQSGWNVPSAQFTTLDNEAALTGIKAVTIGFDELGFNCADKKKYPKSTGHPVLTDPAFRSALQWAVDKAKIVSIGYNGNAAPADTIVMRDYYSAEADYHWTPPAGDPNTYTFDLEKAKAALDAAGYTDGDGNGIREYKGKDIKLRLYARTESPESQNCGKLITGWFEDIGLDINYQIIDDGALGDKQYNYDGGAYAPDFDMFIWGWGGDVDPNFILSILTTDSIEAWSDSVWSNAEYDKLFLEQQSTVDVQKRIDLVKQMQQIVYKESPYIPLVYPLDLEVADTTNWTGWVRANQNKGAWWYNTQPDTYLAVQKGAAVQKTTSSNTGVIVAAVIAVIVVLAIVVLLVRRRGGRSEVEA